MWNWLKNFFKHSETLLLARLNALIGAVATVMSYIDPALLEPLLTSQTFSLYVFFNGIVFEYMRRRRATFPDDEK